MNILYVENHARFADIAVKTFLTEHNIVLASSLAAARLALAQDRFDLIFLDQDLDDGKGEELAAELCRLPERPPIIAVSSHDAGNAALRLAGADAVCKKSDFRQIAALIAGLPGHAQP